MLCELRINKQIYYYIKYNIFKMINKPNHSATSQREALISTWMNIKSWITNISYQIEEISVLPFITPTQCYPNTGRDTPSYYIAGRKINDHHTFLEQIQSLIWLTYRKNAEIAPRAYSDVGWGCLLRVTQMAFANALLRYSTVNSTFNRLQIIGACIQDSDAEYGLTSFIEAGEQLWSKSVGSWYSMTESAMMLQALQEKKSLKRSQQFKVAVYNQTVSIDELFEYFGREAGHMSQQHGEEKNIQQKIQQILPFDLAGKSGTDDVQDTLRHIFLMITTQLSKQSRSKNELQLLKLMELPIFSSCLGGVPEKARFIVGKSGDKICYLDPHYVQQSVPRSHLEHKLSSFACKKPRWMKAEQLESNLTICFHLQNESDVELLMQAINEMMQKYPREHFISYSSSQKQERGPLYYSQQIQPQFQILQPSKSSDEIERISIEDALTI